MFEKLAELMKFRNNHKAFDGDFELMETPNEFLGIKWKNAEEWTSIDVDLKNKRFKVIGSQEGSEKIFLSL